jgi:hypothetical protein
MTLSQLHSIALALPSTTEEPHFDYSSFRVKGRIFVTVRAPASIPASVPSDT